MRKKLSPKLERKHRASARLALYGSLVLVAALLVPFRLVVDQLRKGGLDPAWAKVDYASMREVQLLREYVRIDTSTSGSEIEGAEFLAAQLEAAGVPVTVERMGNNKANLWAVLEGKRREAVVLHNHIDTDPIKNPEEWTHDPFAAEIDGPRLFGRGVFDMKGVAISQLVAFLELAERAEPPEYSIVFLATGSEEIGSELGSQWFLREHQELTERFVLFLTEGGVIEAVAADDIKYWGTEFAQKRYVDFVFCSSDRQRLEDLYELLRSRRYRFRGLALVPEVDLFLGAYADSRGWEKYRKLLGNRGNVPYELASFEALQPVIKHMFRNEYWPFAVEESAGGGYELLVKIHLLPGADAEETAAVMFPQWIRHGFDTYMYAEDSATGGSPTDHPIMEVISQVVQKRYPDTPTGPMFLATTATDARFARRWGIPSYGFSPFPVFSTDTMQVGQANERITLPSYVTGVEIYTELVAALAGQSGAAALDGYDNHGKPEVAKIGSGAVKATITTPGTIGKQP